MLKKTDASNVNVTPYTIFKFYLKRVKPQFETNCSSVQKINLTLLYLVVLTSLLQFMEVFPGQYLIGVKFEE